MRHHRVLRIISKLLIPFIMLFALYVQFHGDFGPGGGFQAGVIFASAFILYGLIFGLENARKVAPPAVVTSLVAAGVLIYAGTGYAGFFGGGNFLDYGALSSYPVAGPHLGILVSEFGVGPSGAASMITIFFLFAGRDR